MTFRSDRQRGGWKLPGTIAVLSAAVAFAVGLTTVPSVTPSVLASAPAAETAPVSTVPFRDARTVQVTTGLTESGKLVTGLDGTLTSSSCISGKPVTSGTSTFSVDGDPLINLATATPLWRDLGMGDAGEDVTALQTELTRLGYQTPVTGTIDGPTLDAYARMAVTVKAPVDGVRISRDHIIWLPSPTQTVQKCLTTPGSRIAVGQEIADLPPQITSAQIANIPQTVAPGERALIIDGNRFPVPADGLITDASHLADLGRLPSFLASQGSDTPGTLAAQYELATPTRVLAVPPGALFGVEATKACLSSGSVTYPVAILGSQLGAAFVAGKDTEHIIEIDLTPGPDARCE